MAYRKRTWVEKNWKELLNSFVSSVVGAVIVLVAANVQQKPSSRDLRTVAELSQSNHNMTVTAYIPTGKKAATLVTPRPGLHAAVSRDRLDLLGKRVYVKCEDTTIGIRDIVDVTDDDIINTLDIMMPTEKVAVEFGKQTDCEVIKLGQIR